MTKSMKKLTKLTNHTFIMKTIRFIALAILIGIGVVSCRQDPKNAKQDVVEDINQALEQVDKEIKSLDPNKTENPDDDIQNEIDRLQDSISNDSINKLNINKKIKYEH